MGLITDSAGVAVVTPLASGKLETLKVKTGDVVSEGDLLARVE
ncbi:MAG: biotin/lipoyl-binding protein, partial [Selenomonas sp.]|nr:biotin/lipoyl-binding protein [Selenomonas sp.]